MFAQRTNWNLAANRLSETLAAHRRAEKPLLDLTVSNPTECGFQYDQAAIVSALQNPAALKYEPNPRGLELAREAVRQYYADRGGAVSIDDIFLTTSTSEAYGYAFRTLCDPHDQVLIPEPSYPLFEFLADLQDVRLVRYPLVYDHGWQIDLHALERAITARTRAIIVVNPNNPTGNFCKAREMQELDEICSSRGMAIITDEVFYDFSLSDQRPSCPASTEALTFTLSGLSKISGLPQMKVAWAIVNGPEPLKSQAQARFEVIADTYLSMNAPVQWALPSLLALRHGFQGQLLTRVRANLADLDRQLDKHNSVSRLELEAGWNAVLRVPATRSDEEFALELLSAKGVYAHPGHFYDFPGDGYFVVSLITPQRDFATGIERMLSML